MGISHSGAWPSGTMYCQREPPLPTSCWGLQSPGRSWFPLAVSSAAGCRPWLTCHWHPWRSSRSGRRPSCVWGEREESERGRRQVRTAKRKCVTVWSSYLSASARASSASSVMLFGSPLPVGGLMSCGLGGDAAVSEATLTVDHPVWPKLLCNQ